MFENFIYKMFSCFKCWKKKKHPKSIPGPFTSLTNEQEQKQVEKMIAFVENEANELVKSIEEEAEEQCEKIKFEINNEGVQKIDYDHKIKMNHLQLRLNAEHEKRMSELRLWFQRMKYEQLEHLHKEMIERVTYNINNEDNTKYYRKILRAMIVQGALMLLETKVHLKIRLKDLDLINSVLRYAKKDYSQYMPSSTPPLEIEILSEYLPEHSIGGVIIYNKDLLVHLNNTLEERIENSLQSTLPFIQIMYFDHLHEMTDKKFKTINLIPSMS